MNDILGESYGAGRVVKFGKKDYLVGHRYGWEELPSQVQDDVDLQEEEIESRFGRDPKSLSYRFIVIPYADLVRHLEDRYGDRYKAKLKSPMVIALARDIEANGLKTPPVLEEGMTRALALARLGWDMPYFTIDEPIEMPEPLFIPSLDGRWPEGRHPLGR